MVDVSSYSPRSSVSGGDDQMDSFIPEDNVERLRNIRDMFENTNANDEDLVLQKVEKLQPGDKIKDRFKNDSSELDDNNSTTTTTPATSSQITTQQDNSNSSSSPNSSTSEIEFDDLETNHHLQTATAATCTLIDAPLAKSAYACPPTTTTTTAQQIMDTSNFILQEQKQERSINGSDDLPVQVVNVNEELMMLEQKSNGLLSVNGINLVSSSSTSVTSSMSSSMEPQPTAKSCLIDEMNNNNIIDDQHRAVDSNEQEQLIDLLADNGGGGQDFVTSFNNSSQEMHVADGFNQVNDECGQNRFEEGLLDDEDEDEEEAAVEGQEEAAAPKKSKNKKKDIIAFADLNNVKNKFESIANDAGEVPSTPKPMRSITPPPDGAARTEIENEPMQRPANVVSVYEKVEDALPAAGYTRSRKEIFASASSPSQDQAEKQVPPRVKSITPPRDEALKRVLKEQTPERNENVVRESDRIDDVLPNAGAIKQTAAMFTNSSARLKSIERSGISIEGELAEKGIAKSRLALFNDPNALQSANVSSTTELESEIIKNASGIAKERLNLFKNLEQQQQPNARTSPSRELKKLKEFTPPPQLDHQQQQRQYIIIDKESNEGSAEAVRESSSQAEEFMPETGLAKSRMKQYLESTSQNAGDQSQQSGEELPKGLAKSLLAKWKSIENVKDKETSPESSRNSASNGARQTSPSDSASGEEFLPQSGHAKSLLNKFQNIESSSSNRSERRGPRPITPPPPEELERQKLNGQDESDSANVKPYVDEELAIIGRGHAKSTLAKFESTPLESGLNAQFAEEEVIPAAGHAKNLKNKFLNLEKEAAKIETSSSKMHYVPKKFTSATSPMTPPPAQQQPAKQQAANGKPNGQKSATNGANGAAAANGHANSNSNAEKCCVCDKTVYAMEKIEADKKVYHKLCFKCTSCNCTLKLGNFSSIKQTLYCTPHYIQLFARNGNYDEGFGLENYKRKWLQRSPEATATN